MGTGTRSTVRIALFVALGGFLMGFDASVISGVVGFVRTEFDLTSLQLGWGVASLTLSATVSMLVAGPLSDRLGRRPVLRLAAALFALSAIASAVAPTFATLVVARMLGGLGVGAALIIAPMYIAEMAPSDKRGRLVSFNQLNIVVGISVAFFSNYLILGLTESPAEWVQWLGVDHWPWRWMLGIEALPALLYLLALLFVPESPRWLAMRGREAEARHVLEETCGPDRAGQELEDVLQSLRAQPGEQRSTIATADLPTADLPVADLLAPAMRTVLTLGLAVAVLQQITGINAVFFYAPMIFEQSGIGRDASFMQAVLVGLVNVVFTVVAMLLIDKIGRRPLLLGGLAGITACMLTLSWAFADATYTLDRQALAGLPVEMDTAELTALQDRVFPSDLAFREAVSKQIGAEQFERHKAVLIAAAMDVRSLLILVSILGFVASFAVSLGPVMWVLFSELFPNTLRGLAVSVVGVVNSAVSFTVQLVFPWELEHLGTATTFLLYGAFALIGLVFIWYKLPETKERSLEELQRELVEA